MHEQLIWLRVAALAGSVAVHVGAYAALGASAEASNLLPGPTAVDFEVVSRQRVVEAAKLPPLDEETTVDPEEPEPAEVAQAPPAPEEPVEVDQEAPGPAEPVDLTGVTLTNDGAGAGWASMVGDGSRMRGPLRRPTARLKDKPRAQATAAEEKPVGGRTRARKPPPLLVPVSDLSRRPSPPALDAVLQRHYPAEARRRGLAGQAVVTARIDADGRVRWAQILSETDAGFGRACRNTVVGSVWTPPFDRNGRPVATRIRYTCGFRVSR